MAGGGSGRLPSYERKGSFIPVHRGHPYPHAGNAFFRLDRHADRNGGGTGPGLPLSGGAGTSQAVLFQPVQQKSIVKTGEV